MRLATFTEMVNSGNALLIDMAITEGHASDDPILRNLAVRVAFSAIRSFTPELVPVSEQGEYFHLFGQTEPSVSQLRVEVTNYDIRNGSFGDGQAVSGRISADILSFEGDLCSGNLRAVENTWVFRGPLTCSSLVHGGRGVADRHETFSSTAQVQIR